MQLKKIKENKFFRFYQRYFKNRMGFIVALLLLIIVGVATSNIGPLLYGRMIDFITTSNLNDLTNYIVIYFFVIMGSVGMGVLEGYLGQILSFKITNDVKMKLYNKILHMRFKKLDEFTVGELISRLESDAGSIVDYYINFATSVALIIFNLIISLYFVFSISIQLSTVSILFIPASVMITVVFRGKFKALSKKEKKFSDKYYGFINEAFANLKGIRSYQLEDSFASRFKGFIAQRFGLVKRSIFLENSMNILSQLITLVFTLVVIYLSAVLIMEGKLTVGSMVAFNTYINNLFNAVSRILNLNISAQSVSVSMDRIEAFENEMDETDLHCATDEKDIVIHSISLEGVSFAYKDTPVLQNLSMQLDKNGLYGIVGNNGCGKSTLAKLLIRFYDIDSGYIKFNGINQHEININSLRNNFTYIQKEIFITNESLLENIKIANRHAGYKDVVWACEKAGLTQMIENLPEKYETKLGENGSLLSSGQKQKLNIARAILRQTPVFLLDEVTSDLDGAAEKEILSIIQNIATQSIVIFISHKASSLMGCDQIYVMADGQFVAQGSHNQLINNNTLYRKLFSGNENEPA